MHGVGSALKKVGHIGSAAIKLVDDIGNTVAGSYNTINSITGGALDKTLKTVSGVAPAMALGGPALKFYNKSIDPRRAAIQQVIDKLGDRLQDYAKSPRSKEPPDLPPRFVFGQHA